MISAGATSNVVGDPPPPAASPVSSSGSSTPYTPPPVASPGNVISGNSNAGVVITDAATQLNTLAGNLIGTDTTGTKALANHFGVQVIAGASNNAIGVYSGVRNVISGNAWDGVQFLGANTSGNTLVNNFVGTNASGTAALPNAGSGLALAQGASGNLAAYDTLSGNGNDGVYISDSGTSGNLISGDMIGTDPTGARAIGNLIGVQVLYGATNNTIGSSSRGPGDTISGNAWDGVQLIGSGTTGNVVQGDFIGTSASGSYAVPNGGRGVAIAGAASSNTVGAVGAGNVISGNTSGGVYLSDPGTASNTLADDLIGLASSGSYAVPNGSYGVLIQNGATSNVLGGWSAASRDVISGNSSIGVLIQGSGTSNNEVLYDFIGTDSTGLHAVGNAGTGVVIENGATSNFVYQSVVSGNQAQGISIMGPTTSWNEIYMDKIGDDANGAADLGNAAAGVLLYNTSNNFVFYNSIDDNGDVGLRFWDQALNNYYSPNSYTNNRGGSIDSSLN